MPFTVTVLKHGCCKDLILALGTACCLRNDEYLLLAEVTLSFCHTVYSFCNLVVAASLMLQSFNCRSMTTRYTDI